MSTNLDWETLLDFAKNEALSSPGRQFLEKLTSPHGWAQSAFDANRLQDETHEASLVIERAALWSGLRGLEDPTPYLDQVQRGGVLDLVNLVWVQRWLYAIDSWVQFPTDDFPGKLMREAVHFLFDPFSLLKEIDPILTPEGDLSESASPELARANSEIRKIKTTIQSKLAELMSRYQSQGVLRDAVSDLREGHYVLPVRISDQSQVPGISYESSVSKQTIFIEPAEIAPLSARLQSLQNERKEIIFKILKEISAEIQPNAQEISNSILILAKWDSVAAKVRLARKYGGRSLQVTEERAIELQDVAHPLLFFNMNPREIIRNSLTLSPPQQAVLISGPNAGGKTVLLKTIGLAAICARTGFFFPVGNLRQVSFFDQVLVDLGDPQSLEAHLSSFSGRMGQVKKILGEFTSKSLVLIDELNTATDPEEGSALSRAIVENLLDNGAMVIATTHDPWLKTLGLDDDRIMSAGMEFDDEKRVPLFRMESGVPGRSRAIEVAENLGLGAEIIQRARGYLSKQKVDFETVLKKLEFEKRHVDRLREEAQTMLDQVSAEKEKWKKKATQSVEEITERSRKKLKEVLFLAETEISDALKRMTRLKRPHEMEEVRQSVQEQVKHFQEQVDREISEEAPEVHLTKTEASVVPQAISVGMWVRVPKLKSLGKVVSLDQSRVQVLLGNPNQSNTSSFKFSVEPTDLELLEPAQAKSLGLDSQYRKKTEAVISGMKSADSSSVSTRLDLRGFRFEEAMSELEQYLDRAFRKGLREVHIIHGLGTGALRDGTRSRLAKLPYIRDYRDGGAGMGGAGATIVVFDQD